MGPLIRRILNRIDPRQRSDLFKRSFKNAAWSSGDYLALLVLWLVATPFFVHKLGVDQYGIWMLVNASFGFSGVLAFGLSDATIKYVAKYRALGDQASVVRVIRSTLTLYGILGLLAAVVTFFASPFLIHNVFKVHPQNLSLAIASLQIGGVGILVRFIDNVFLSVLQGYERYDLAAKVSVPTNVLMIVLAVLCAVLGLGLLAILWTTVLILSISAAAKAVVVRRILIPGILFLPIMSKQAMREIFGFGFYSWLQSLGGILLAQTDRLIIASFLGTSALAYYTVCLQLAQQVHAILSRAVAFLFPLVSNVKETNDLPKVRTIYFKAMNFTAVAAVAMGLPIFLFAHNILSLWMGTKFADEAYVLLQVLAFVFTLWSTSIVPYYTLNGAGFYKLNTILGFAGGLVVTIFAFFMVPAFGTVGAGLSRMLTLPTSLVGRTITHFTVLKDQRWYAPLPIFLPIIVVFGIVFLANELLGQHAMSVSRLIMWIAAVSLFGLLVTGVLVNLLNKNPLEGS
jgi:O-antigen/teichoic acid export membrane protein